MDAAVIVFVLIALAVGALIGWLIGSRDGGGASADRRKTAACSWTKWSRSAIPTAPPHRTSLRLKRPRGTREIVPAADRSAQGRQGEPFGAIPRDRRQIARRGAQDLPRAGRRRSSAKGCQPVEMLLKPYQEKLQTIEKERVDHYAGLREAVELVRTGQGRFATRPAAWSMLCARRPRRAAAGANRASRTSSNRRASAHTPISKPKCRSRARTDVCARTSWCGCRAGESW